MSDAPPPGPDAPGPPGQRAFTLDLSSPGAPARPKRPKGFVPVVQQTINLTTKRAEAPTEAPTPRAEVRPPPGPTAGRSGPPDERGRSNRRDGGRRDDGRRDDQGRRDGGRSGGGTSLADLLDEATIARLRGGA
jgi:hypothetical protein